MPTRAVARDKRRLKSSGGKCTSLPRVRAAHGASRSSSSGRASHHELLDGDYGGIRHLKLPSARPLGICATAKAAGVYSLRNQLRWHRSTSSLSTLDANLTTSGFGAAVLQQLRPVLPVLAYNYIECFIITIFGGGGSSGTHGCGLHCGLLNIYSSTSFCASLGAGRAGVCCVCAGVHRAPQHPIASLY
jgi:hypothetical protein